MESNQVAALSIGLSILFVTGVFVLLSGYYKNRTFFDSNTVFYVKKWTYILFLVSLNVVGCVFVYYFRSLNVLVYVILALKSKDLITSVVFLFNMIYKHLFTNLEIPQLTVTDEIKRIVALVPVYNETIEQLTKTVDSILNSNVTPNYTMPCIVVDGLENNYLEIFDELIVSKKDLYYKNWFGSDVSTNVFYGKRRDHHIMMIQKATRVGKKDTIILVNDIFNRKRSNITSLNKNFRQDVNQDILNIFGISAFDYLFSTDADTIIDSNTINCLADSIKTKSAIAVCGVVNVDKSSGSWFWNNLQNFQYLYGQYTRRTTEDLFGQVLCLPGCISMFRLCNRSTYAQKFYSQIPEKSDLVVSSVQYVGTDRRYTSNLIYNTNATISMDTRCHAYTVPPQSLKSYISQRRRWTQNTYFNTMINIIAPNVNFVLRVFCLIDYLRLSLVYFRLFNTLFFIYVLASEFNPVNLIDLVPYIVVLAYPTIVFFVYSIFNNHLRKEWLNMVFFYLVNKVFIMITNVVIFTVMLWNIGCDSWSAQSVQSTLEEIVI
jgi:cellulose synthase/poly-beta-1,6-N-acetylglucosamine synthase-like glycosyltransferase